MLSMYNIEGMQYNTINYTAIQSYSNHYFLIATDNDYIYAQHQLIIYELITIITVVQLRDDKELYMKGTLTYKYN